MLVPAKAGIGVGGLLNQALQAHHLVGHRCFLDQVGVRNPTHNRRIIDDRPRSRPPLRRQMKARDGRLRYRPATPLGGTRPPEEKPKLNPSVSQRSQLAWPPEQLAHWLRLVQIRISVSRCSAEIGTNFGCRQNGHKPFKRGMHLDTMDTPIVLNHKRKRTTPKLQVPRSNRGGDTKINFLTTIAAETAEIALWRISGSSRPRQTRCQDGSQWWA
jgi:hypothetical protein